MRTTSYGSTRDVPLMSPTLEMNERVRVLRGEGRSVVHLGFGEAGLPVADILVDALRQHAGDNRYGEVAGSAALRDSVAHYFTRRGLATETRQVIVGPGSKSLLYGTLLALDSDVVLSTPSWVSYAPQVLLIGRRCIRVPIPASTGGIPDPETLNDFIDDAGSEGLKPRTLILTQPDNPTGTLAPRESLEQLATVIQENDMWVISDEIYRDLTFDSSQFVSIVDFVPERTIITTGLSKSLALGGWRIGAMRVPDTTSGLDLVRDVIAVGSEIWSGVSAPVAAAAKIGFDEPSDIVQFIERARQLHSKVSLAVYDVFNSAGVPCRAPQAAFYMYPDLDVARDYLRANSITNDRELANYLMESHHVAVLPGSSFGDDPYSLRFRVATSQLYGATADERRTALEWANGSVSTTPSHIASELDQIRGMVEGVVFPT